MISTIYDGGQPFGNACGLQRLDFVEFTCSQPLDLALALYRLGLECKGYTYNRSLLWYGSGEVSILINQTNFPSSGVQQPAQVSAMGWQVSNADRALQEATKRGAKAASETALGLPAVYGVNNCLIYFIDSARADQFYQEAFVEYPESGKGSAVTVQAIGQVNQQVPQGHLQDWVKFYQTTFGFHIPKRHRIATLSERLNSTTIVSPDGQIMLCLSEQDSRLGNGSQRKYGGDSITLLGADFSEQTLAGAEVEQFWPDEILVQPAKPVYTNESLIA